MPTITETSILSEEPGQNIHEENSWYPPTKTTPWPHQIAALNLAIKKDAYYLAHDMGTGKTKTAIDIINAKGAQRVLIWCPKSVVDVWPYQFALHSHTEYKIIAPPTHPGFSVKKKAAFIQKYLHHAEVQKRPAVVVLNYESAWRTPLGPTYNQKNRMIQTGLLRSMPWDIMICDEVHRIKAAGGRASFAAYHVGQAARMRLGLSGTPFPNDPLDIYAQFRFLKKGLFPKNFSLFRARYAVMQACQGPKGAYNKVVEYQNLEELNRIFFSHAHRVEKRDVVDLPAVMHEYRYAELEPAARRAYDKLNQEFVVQVAEGELTVQNALTKMLRLAQITSGYMPLDDEEEGVVISSAKLDVLADLLTDLPMSEPVAIFCRFRPEMDRVKERCLQLGRSVSQLRGGVNELAEWQAGHTNVIVIQIRSGGEGVDLTRCRYTVYLSKGFSLKDYEQSLARMDRPGQEREGVYFHILAKSTVDIREMAALKAKKKVVDYVMEGVRKEQSDPAVLQTEAVNDALGTFFRM